MAGGFLSSPGRSAKARVTPESTSSGFIPSNTSNPSINGEYTPIRSSLASNWPGGRSLFYRFVVKSSSHMSSKARNLTKKSEKKCLEHADRTTECPERLRRKSRTATACTLLLGRHCGTCLTGSVVVYLQLEGAIRLFLHHPDPRVCHAGRFIEVVLR